jgi:guanylate kinase
VLAGPSGVGKGTVVAQLRRRHPEVWLSVSATTRPPRPGEVDGVDYRFLSDAAFDAEVATGGMLEWAEFSGHRYGTPADPVRRRLDADVPVLLEIDLQGARQVRSSQPEALLVMLAPPDPEELRRRLIGRGTEDAATVDRRLRRAVEELAAAGEFDAVLVNDDVEPTVDRLVALMGLSTSITDGQHPAH